MFNVPVMDDSCAHLKKAPGGRHHIIKINILIINKIIKQQNMYQDFDTVFALVMMAGGAYFTSNL